MKRLTEDETTLWTALFEQSGDAMVVLRQDGSVYRANQRYADMLGYTLEEMKDLYVWDWDTLFSKQELQEMLLNVDNSSEHFDTRHRRKNGTIIDAELSNNGALYKNENLIFCIVRDTTERKSTEERLRRKEELLQRISSQVPGALYQYRMAPDGARSFPFFSEGIAELGGLTQEQLSGTGTDHIMSHVLPEDAANIEANIQKTARSLTYAYSEFRILHTDGSIRWIESRSTPHKEPDGSTIWTGILLDVTQRKMAEERVKTMAITDGLTGINNRLEFNRLLEQEIERSSRYHMPFSLIMYDLDHFKQVNDRFGHNAGDDVLNTVTRLVNDNIRSIDIHGRWGGEEFMVILPQTCLEAARDVAEKLRRAIATYHFNQVGTVTASFGVTEFIPRDDSKLMAQRADDALYRAKSLGRNRVEV
ncbi:sensor domain-containing diguanylate cyclase [Vreelandella salicampi]|uniref:diguanylate cyclase n=1 Tax=Vreelandella salicampi TaxID=1449798 RepID=A0A7Z0RVB2_9GAMM|nr:sensor domain-containing diguanylate cyclase [Halomonas salicampi]NYS61418.1 diguanylate cyclase [Halomonas salicampi]